ncbi:MAG: hypothetical protein LBU48_07675, partial [Coriobacteriales bacterium]|nr:hypothetical protein [Coriobacteriales bacterium]
MQVTKSKPLFRVLLSFILVGAFCLPGFGSAKAAQASEVLPSAEVNPDYASGEIIVVYQNAEEQGASGGFGLLSADEPDPLEATNFEVIEELVDATEETGTIVLAQIPEGETVEEAIEEAESLPGVAYAQPNYHYALMDELSSADDLVDEYEQTLAELLPADALADVVLPTDDSEAAEDTAFGALATTTDPDNNNSIGYGY